jgi:chondroitin 4-sulfotransferase 11
MFTREQLLTYIKSPPIRAQYKIIETGPGWCIYDPNLKDYHRSLILPADDEIYERIPFIPVMITKTGGHSLEHELYTRDIPSFGHVYPRFFPTKYRSKLRAFVRNPYDRAVSAYFFMKKGGFNQNKQYMELVAPYDTFEKWVLHGLKKKYTHWKEKYYAMETTILQSEWLVDEEGTQIIPDSQIGRFESLAKDVHRLLGFELTFHQNKTEHLPWPQYYTNPDVRHKVYQLYQPDFDRLGYSSLIDC